MKQETSKIILFRTFWIFWILVAVVIAATILFPATGDSLVNILQIAAT